MIRFPLQAVLRSFADAPSEGDGELLRRFLNGDEGAFADLVRRHGRLVWAACRNLTGSDAEADDAFQATFLVLLRNAGKIRDANRLSAWLHGVAYRVCAKARQTAKRRTARERAAATSERKGSPVADSAWDRALAAVHEEVGRLPESLRVPFVLCCLEGKGAAEAAEQLGWKLGTLSGRLTRAKDALLARLEARGLALGAVAGLGLATPPSSALAKAAALARDGLVVPNSVLQLTQGVIGMSAFSFKMLAAAVLLTCGLGLGAGTGWIAVADAQSSGPLQEKPIQLEQKKDEVKRLRDQLEAAERAILEAQKQYQSGQSSQARQKEMLAEYAKLIEQARKSKPEAAAPSKWEYDFVAVSDMDQANFAKFLQDRDSKGWEFSGTTPLTRGGKTADTWVFRRPVKVGFTNTVTPDAYGKLLNNYYNGFQANKPLANKNLQPPQPLDANRYSGSVRDVTNDAKVIEAEIAKLQDKLATLKGRNKPITLTFAKKDLPLEPAELTELLQKLAGRKFKNVKYTFLPTSTGIVLEGDREVLDWARATIKKLSEK